MGDRPLRWYSAEEAVPAHRSGSVEELVDRWVAHRERLLAELGELDDADWDAPTRCEDWSVREVVLHLVTVDQFWTITLQQAAVGAATSFLLDFDPSNSPDQLIDPMRADPPAAVLERFAASSAVLTDVVTGYPADAWSSAAESPLGQVRAELALAHAFWDSWLHERDILVPLGRAVDPDARDVLLAADYSLLAAGMQGGLVDDPAPVAPGPEATIEAVLHLDDVDATLRVRIGTFAQGVVVEAVEARTTPDATTTSALALVEGFTGRQPLSEGLALPPDLLAHFERSAAVL